MKILQLRLHPFAGIADREVKFHSGLNVVLGPNEAGKSTLVSALRCVLFFPTAIGQKVWRDTLQRFVPLGGGDTFRVTLDFERAGQTNRLSKSWGQTKSSELSLPGGQIVTSPDEIATRMAELLGHRQGTWENVLFAYQGQVSGTMKSVLSESDERNDLAQILRRATLNTDGVSIERLGRLIGDRYRETFSRWDSKLERPENNRRSDDPWKQKVGKLLQAWYERDKLQREHQRTLEYERKLDDLTAQINRLSRERDDLKQFVNSHKDTVADAQTRQSLGLKIGNQQADYDKLKGVLLEWPVANRQLNQLLADRPKLEQQVSAVVAEIGAAKAYDASRAKREQLKVAREFDEKLEVASRTRAGMKAISDEQLNQFKTLDLARKELEAGLAAGQLKLTFCASGPTHLTVGRDLDAESEVDVSSEGPLQLQAGGRIVLKHADWTLSVESGEVGFEELQRQHQETSQALQDGLRDLGVRTLTEAQSLHGEFVSASAVVAGLEQRVGEILAGETIESLVEQVGMGELPAPSRGLDDMGAEKTRLENQLDQDDGRCAEFRSKIAEWTEAYESLDALPDRMVDAKGILNDLKNRCDQLRPLPPDVTDVDAFIAEFERRRGRLTTINETELPAKQLEQSELQREAPDRSLAEMDEMVRDAETRYEQTQREARATERVRQAFQPLRESLDSGTLTPWLDRIKSYVAPLTVGRYTELRLEQGETRRTDALDIPVDLLSVGTRACLGLAVRLSMASYFLDVREGCLLLDDPLVDLDPDRQTAAVDVLKRFATDKQVVVFTCHPRHAELFSVEPIEVYRDR